MNAVIAQARQNLLDRCGKSGKHQLFNTSLTSGQAVRITRRKVNGQLQRRPQGESLVQESKDVKNYLTKNKFEVFSGGFKSSLNSNWDFVKKENWTKLGAAGKYVKGAGVVGTGFMVYSDIKKYDNKKPTSAKTPKLPLTSASTSARAPRRRVLVQSLVLPFLARLAQYLGHLQVQQ